MPVVLENSHSHSFSYRDENGQVRDVTVKKGQDIEGLNLPDEVLGRLRSDFIIGFNGKERKPRYVTVDATAKKRSYNTGPITTTRRNDQLAAQHGTPADSGPSREELLAMQRAAEEAEAKEQEDQFREASELKAAEAEREARSAEKRAKAAEAEIAKLKKEIAAQGSDDLLGDGDKPEAPRRGRPPHNKG